MSLGGDLAAGINVGVRTNPINNLVQPADNNAWPYLTQNSKNNSDYRIALLNASVRGGGGGGGSSAGRILKDSQTEYLDNKERELKIEAQRINNEGLKIANASQQQTMDQSKRAFEDKRIADADAAAKGLRTEATATASSDEQKSLNNAARGFYTRDSGPILDYINKYGSPTQNVKAIDFDDPENKGQVFVDFGDNKVAAFASPRDAIEKILMPMTLVEQGIKGQMNEKEKAETDIKKGQLEVDKTRADAYSRNVDNAAKNIEGKTGTEREKAIDSAYRDYLSDIADAKVTPELDPETGESKIWTRDEFAAKRGYNKGDKNPAGVDYKKMADDAIAKGADPAKVKQRYKELTGKDY